MRCSELAALSRSLLSHPASFAHPAAQAARQCGQSLSLGSLGVASRLVRTEANQVTTNSML